MHRAISVLIESPIDQVMPILADLATYPTWLGLVHTVEPVADDGGVFQVTLRAKVGPFSRSKKLRMVRTEYTDSSVRFEREETDGREHANWIMSIDAEPADGSGTLVEIALTYDGDLWSAPVEAVLDAQAERAGRKLDAYADAARSVSGVSQRFDKS